MQELLEENQNEAHASTKKTDMNKPPRSGWF
jgi:hypothetical protein